MTNLPITYSQLPLIYEFSLASPITKIRNKVQLVQSNAETKRTSINKAKPEKGAVKVISNKANSKTVNTPFLILLSGAPLNGYS